MKLPPSNARTKKRYLLSLGLGIMFLAGLSGWLWRFKYFPPETQSSLLVITPPLAAVASKQLVLSPTQLKPVALADNNSLKILLTTILVKTASLSATWREFDQSLNYPEGVINRTGSVDASRTKLNEALAARLDDLNQLSAQINLEAGEMPEEKEPLLDEDKGLKSLVGELLNLRQQINEATGAAQLTEYFQDLFDTKQIYQVQIPKYQGYRLLYGLRYLTGRVRALWPNLVERADGFSANPASEKTLKPLLADYQSELFQTQDSMATAAALLSRVDTESVEVSHQSLLTLIKTYDDVLAALGKMRVDLQLLLDFWLKPAAR